MTAGSAPRPHPALIYEFPEPRAGWRGCDSAPGPRGSRRVWFPEESRGSCAERRDHMSRQTDVTVQGGGGTSAGGWPGQSGGGGSGSGGRPGRHRGLCGDHCQQLCPCQGLRVPRHSSPRSPRQRRGRGRRAPISARPSRPGHHSSHGSGSAPRLLAALSGPSCLRGWRPAHRTAARTQPCPLSNTSVLLPRPAGSGHEVGFP